MTQARPRTLLTTLHGWVGRLIDSLADPQRGRRTALLLGLAYTAVWTLYGTVSNATHGVVGDMAELLVWAQMPDWGYPRHPPLLAWVAAGWFAIFPQSDWAFYLLAMATCAAGLFLGYVAAGEWLTGIKRASAPFLLALIPFYNFHGLKFDQNSALIPLWALTLLAFVRSYRTGSAAWGALAGFAAAAAVLTKYWSVFLILGLAVAALADRRRWDYLRSTAPWAALGVGAACIAPHVFWLFAHDFPTLIHATGRQAASWWQFLTKATVEYLGGTAAYAALAIAVFIAVVRLGLAAWKDITRPMEDDRRFVRNALLATLLLPIAFAAFAKIAMLSLWSAPLYTFLPALLLSSPLVKVTREHAIRIAAVSIALACASLLLAPAIAAWALVRGYEQHGLYVRLAAAAVEKEWQATTQRPLRLVAAPFSFVDSVAFYIADKPLTFSGFSPDFIKEPLLWAFSLYVSPWADERKIGQGGVAIICPRAHPALPQCLQEMDRLTAAGPAGRRTEVVLTPRWLGITGASERFVIATVPPRT